MAFPDATKNVVWLCEGLRELKIPKNRKVIYQNNSEADEWAAKIPACYYSWRKKVDIRHYLIMDIIYAGETRIVKVATEAMINDFLTKPLALK